MSYALRERSRAAFPRAVGEAGRWAMDGTADRTQLLSVWRQQWNNGTQWRLSERKRGGATWDFSVKHPSTFVFASVFEFTAVRQGERLVSVNEGLSPRHRIHSTTYTGGGSVQVTHQKTHTKYIKSWSKLQACMSYSCFMTSQRWKVSRFSKSTSQFHFFFSLHPVASLQLRTTKCVFINGFLIFIVVDYFN